MGSWKSDGEEACELEDEESFSYAAQLANSIVLPMALQSAADLGVFDVFQKAGRNAKLSADNIASRLSCNNPKMIDRILALLASHSVLNCSLLRQQDPLNKQDSFHRLYTAAPVARFFASDSDGVSLVPLMTLHHHNNFFSTWSQLKDVIREGGTIPHNRIHKSPSLDSSGFNQILNTAMRNHSTLVMKKVLECYKGFEDVKRLVDVGGGLGININLITSKYPHIQGINFDLPHVIQQAPPYPGVEHVGGDMFESVPKGDAIFMKWIIHYWSDEHCLKILKNCYDATPDDGKVIVLEAILPIIPENNAAWKVISQSDVLMMTRNRGGRERTEQEFMDLATGAGFGGIRYECYVRTFWVMEFFK